METELCVVSNGARFSEDSELNIVGVFTSKSEAITYIKKHFPSPWGLEPDDIRSPWVFNEVPFKSIRNKYYILK